KPVTTRTVTVGGAVKRPITVEVPVGTRINDLIFHAGGAGVEDFKVIVGGPVMGPVVGVDGVITKTIGGVIVLPSGHRLLELKGQPIRVTKQRAKMCCTCRECTILCPRNALGHSISPAKMMSYSWHIDEIIARIERNDLDPFTERMVYEALLCCQCGVCELYSCIFGLSPNKIYALVVDALKRSKVKVDFNKLSLQEDGMFEYRKLSAATFARKLGLERYLVHTEFEPAGTFAPESVRIPLMQHIGAPAIPVVAVGDKVRRGDLLGEIPEGKLGARVHASIDGAVAAVTGEAVSIEAS
ncbi:MAG: SLBB domain-containing protein, partial [Candidatus Latescibacteria bacterium]|nr:SLBB domain-containing protein [Candidatus Latescibacterota bacterium]